jgi:signal transduction histidine kinase
MRGAVSTTLYAGYLLIPILTMCLGAGLAYWIRVQHWEERGSRAFVAILVAGEVWMGAQAVHLLVPLANVQIVAATVERGGAFLAMTTFVVFVGRYTDRDFHRRWPVLVGLLTVNVGYWLLAITNSVHGLLFTRTSQYTEPFTYTALDLGIGYKALFFLNELLVGLSLLVLVLYLFATAHKTGLQLLLVVLAALSVSLVEIPGQLGLFPADGLYYATYGALPFILFMAVALFRVRLLDVKPVARNTVIEDLRDPVLVVDDRRRVVDYNETATHVWPEIADDAPGAFESVCPALADAVDVPPTDEDATPRISLPYDGQDRHYSVTVSVVSKAGDERTGWYSILLRDITELEQSRWQLEKQNERLDQVASTISHDLRNPINVATGRLELIESRIDGLDIDPEIRDQLRDEIGSVENATDRMQDIIDDILTIAREGKTVDETEPVSLDATAHDAWANVDTRDARLVVADDRTLQADRSKLLTIFENLFRNALDHGPADVTVEVGTTVDGFRVQDDGPGIPTEHADSVFEYGYTTSDGGTGLGLSIVKTMAESHGWAVRHDTDYDEGTRLVFDGLDGDRWDEPAMVESSG